MERLLPHFERISEDTWRCVQARDNCRSRPRLHVVTEETFTMGQGGSRFDIALAVR